MECHLHDRLNPDDQEAVLELLAKSFPQNYHESRKYFQFILNRAPGIRFFLAREGEGALLGALCIMDRRFNYFGIPLEMTGISFMAVPPAKRNFAVTNLMKQKLLAHMDANADLSIGFARKVMDGYWHPHGYLGFTNFGCVVVAAKSLPRRESALQAEPMQIGRLTEVERLYNASYRSLLGPFIRDRSLWEYYLERSSLNRELQADVLLMNKQVVAYVVKQGKHIHELACENGLEKELLAWIAGRADGRDLSFEIGLDHPFQALLSRLPHERNLRYAWNGGHIVRISSIEKILTKIRPVIESRLTGLPGLSCNISLGGFTFHYEEKHLTIGKDSTESETPLSIHDWQKILFGVLTPGQLLHDHSDKSIALLNVMFPVASPQVPFWDHF